MNVKYSRAETAFQHCSDFLTDSLKEEKPKETKFDKKAYDTARRRARGAQVRVKKFDKPQPTCNCASGYKTTMTFRLTTIKPGTKDVCAKCEHYVFWTKELFIA